MSTEHWVRNPNPDGKYVLSATIGSTIVRLRFWAANDTRAIEIAMDEILDRAKREEFYDFDLRFWSKGEIVLTRPNGAILQTMPAKAESDG